ncbi:hypothetical protein YC2023_023958 [Brassica napus]
MYGEFVLTQENIEIPRTWKIYSFNEGNYHMWDECLRKYIDDLKNPGPSGKSYSARYIGNNPIHDDLQTVEDNSIIDDLQVILTITDYNQNTIARLDVDLIITNLKGTNRPPITEEENDTCTICSPRRLPDKSSGCRKLPGKSAGCRILT